MKSGVVGHRCRRAGTVLPGICRALGIFTWRRLLPAAAQSLVELHDAQKFAQTDLRERQLRLEKIAVGVECVELRIHASAIAHVGEPRAILQRGDQTLLLNAALAGSLMRDQCV